MNEARRKEIDAIRERIDTLRNDAEGIRAEISSVQSAEQDYRDNMPESIADGDKGQKADAALEALDATDREFDDVLNALDEALGQLEEARA